ncbi:MAG: glycosyltransferase [Firmicutes bacterium]|nr:glycosyltransferase [Bacillota bacterium]
MNNDYIDSKDIEMNEKIILDSDLFDEKFYLKKYGNKLDDKTNLLYHWLKWGYKESKKPNSKFNTSFYKNIYLDDKDGWNPLTHFIKIGSKNGYKTDIYENSFLEYKPNHINKLFEVLSKKISIFLLVFDFSDDLKQCIKFIYENTQLDFELILLSYGDIPQDYYSKIKDFDENIIIKENDKNDFSEFINENISSIQNDFVIMNNYSFVSPKWLTKLILKAYSDEKINVSFPLSNSNIDIYPNCKNSKGNLEFEKDGINDLFNKFSLNSNHFSDCLDMCCFFVKHNALNSFIINNDDIIFDRKNNKFFIKNLLKNDMCCVIDDTTYVCTKVDLFSSMNKFLIDLSKKNEGKNNLEIIQKSLSKVIMDNAISVIEKCDRKKLFNRILFILEEDELKLTHDFLFTSILKNYDCYFLTTNYDDISLWKDSNRIKVWKINHQDYITKDIIYKTIYFNIINSFKIELVQLNGLRFNSLDILDICKLMEIPIVFYSDDLYYIHKLNEINYLQDNNQNNLTKNYVQKLRCLFEYSDVFLSNNVVRNEYLQIFNSFPKPIEILDNSFSYDLENRLFKLKNSSYIKILIPHEINDKIGNLLHKIKDNKNFSNIEFHIFGDKSDDLNDNFIFHEVTTSQNIKLLIEEINPHFLFITKIFKDIFNIMDLSRDEKIPIFVKYTKLLIDAFDQQPGILLVNTNSSKELFKSMKCGFEFNDYCNILKNMFGSDLSFKKNVALFNQTIIETYTKYQKDFKLTPSNSSISTSNIERKPDFSNFGGFLSHSYTSPFIKAPFLEEDKRCFAVMDNISKYLIKKVQESTEKPLVSIIMPVFNREDVVFDAINSVLNQSYLNWELIIVDDCSTDGTRNLLNTINNDKIKILFHETNSGSSSARNTALNESEGEIIMYLDSDNEWDSRYVEAMVGAFLELPDADALYSGQLIYNNSEKPVAMRFASFNKSLLHNANYIDMNSFCHKRHVINKIGKFDEKLIRLVDWDFILRISNTFKIYSIPILLSKYYVTRADNRITDYTRSHISLSNSNVSYVMKVREKNKFKVNFDKSLFKPVSIIIPSFESLSDLRECINSILNLNYGHFAKIIVVDNNSNEAVRFYLNHLYEENIIDLIQNDDNYGFTHAVNQGISISDEDSDILLMNNDAILTEKALESMQYVAYNRDDCGLVVPQQVLPDGSSSIKTHVPYATNIFECDVNPSKHHNNIINVPIFHDGEILELNFAPFFCVYIKRDVLNNSFGLDAELGRHYRSDRIFSDYVKHVMGLKIYHTSNAVVYHKLLKSTRKLKQNEAKYDLIYLKNRWEEDLAKKLGFKRAIWDY